MNDIKWIKCSERLPEGSDMDLFIVDFFGNVGFAYCDKNGEFRYEPYGRIAKVYAWMPLPNSTYGK